MNRIWLITAVSLIVLGAILCVGVLGIYCNWDFSRLNTISYQTNIYEIQETFWDISIETDTADITFAVSDDALCKVVCHELENVKHIVSVRDTRLTINVVDERKWYEHIGINFGSPKITVYLPQKLHGDLTVITSTGDIEIPSEFRFESIDISADTGHITNLASTDEFIKATTSTGDIRMEYVTADAMELTVTTGNITASHLICTGDIQVNVSTGKTQLSNIKCSKLLSEGNTGDIFLKDVIASDSFSLLRSTGDVRFENCDAEDILVETDTGDVSGSLLSTKIYLVDTDTGKIIVPQTTEGGNCKIETSTGNIKITN